MTVMSHVSLLTQKLVHLEDCCKFNLVQQTVVPGSTAVQSSLSVDFDVIPGRFTYDDHNDPTKAA